MQRTTVGAVKSILGPDYTPRLEVQPFIDSASVIIDRLVVAAQDNGLTLTAGEEELVERWLSAHAYKSVDQAFASKSTGGASGSYQGQTGKYLEGTKYGQMAITIDPSGLLQGLASTGGESAGGFWAGKSPSAEVPFWDR